MPEYNLDTIADITKGKLKGEGNIVVSKLLIDSRKLFSPDKTLFIALKGKNHNGHRYINDLYNKGIRAFLVSEDIETGMFPEASFIFTENTLRALQLIAGSHRKNFRNEILAITGSNGKTIVKEWIFQLTSPDITVIRSPRSYNSQVGVPLSLWLLNDDAELGIIEAGISKPGEMEWLENIIKPDSVLITNIGQAHQENFSSLEDKLIEKLKILAHADTVYYCRDHKLIHEKINLLYPEIKKVTWGTSDADMNISRISETDNGRTVETEWNGRKTIFNIPFNDNASFEDAMHSVLYALNTGIAATKVSERVAALTGVSMRLEVAEGINNCLIIDDAYNLDLNSLEIALDFLNQQGQKKGLSKTVILSDIIQSGIPEELLYSKVTSLLKEKRIDKLICIGQSISRNINLNELNAESYGSTSEFLQKISLSRFRNEAVLLKGARYFSFERIRSRLEQKTHRTLLEINMNALAHNLNVFRKMLNPETMMMVMVKAFSYGSGSFEIANLLQHQNVDYLGVAYTDEGIDLRLAGITIPIMVMNPDVRSFPAMIQYGLEPEIYNQTLLREYNHAVKESGSEKMPVHIKIDTGMSRLGFFPDEISEVAETINRLDSIYVKSAFSHLAASEDQTHDVFTELQISKFKDTAKELERGIGYSFIRHILNSAGIERFRNAQFEMVRMGIGLYGISAINNSEIKNVVSLKTFITQIKDIPAFESIGYGRSGVLDHDARIAIIPVGYADGLDRRLSNGKGKLLINGRFAPIVGNVCMDMCMADITGIKAEEGDSVTVFGEEYSVSDIADACGTIPYEILTGIGRRVKRVYFSE
ncbi:MAG: bifunctional UDP-N-acetylmuramoyl-tripeptide:D-alanyl-D-alanine ligase/alanine racemase [Chlorobi bacterium]|nr:bifunctional UDP-N-acetylmuramoyl-tripeptide:D-alanyl-D-alanine ligase/alanine racemase [Chlorobiota bacterium]